VHELRSLLSGRDADIGLDVAALQLATIEYPHLDIDLFIQMLDSHAIELGQRISDPSDGAEFVGMANEYLFDELGFEGNETDYYNPRNSYLNDVLTSRTGIPITLSVVYMEIARRLEKPVQGIGLPGHFVVAYTDGDFQTYIDPFHAGRLLTAEECAELARSSTGINLGGSPQFLQPVSKRYIVVRMLNNLRGVYVRQGEPAKIVSVLDLLIEAFPAAAEEYRQRGLLNLELQRFPEAKLDLESYLRLAPQAHDRAAIEEQLSKIIHTVRRSMH
jgi:regulator of sirC expression with transglutaminase-like and TPR domain